MLGKTEATLQIAEHYGITNHKCRPRQIFAEIPIGTAALTAEQTTKGSITLRGNHHIEDYYSASLYEQDALEIIDDSGIEGSSLWGGSMMYIDAVMQGY